jgi:small subunit ribosomal protein S13
MIILKLHKLTKYQINRNYQNNKSKLFKDLELARVIQRDTNTNEYYCYRGFRHNAGLPLRGQRTHTNAKTCRKFNK